MTISEAPLYREADANNCANCALFQKLDDEEGICTKHDFKTEADYVCDDFEAAPVTEAQPVEIVGMPAMMSANISDDMFVNFGGAVKSLNGINEPDYAIVYNGKDLTSDYFDKNTEYGFAGSKTKRVPILFHHAQPLDTEYEKRYQEKKPIGEAELEVTDEGVLIRDAILYNRAKYEEYLSQLGWSTGAASHAVDREERGGKTYIKQWLLSELSVTPMSAEPRLKNVVALKSLVTSSVKDVTQVTEAQAEQDKPERVVVPDTIKHITGVQKMELEESKLQEMLAQAAEAGATKAIAATEPVKTSGIVVTKDEGDNEFKSLADHARAVKDFTTSYGRKVDPRLARLIGSQKAVQGASEGNPADGGILLEPTLAGQVMQPVHEVGPFYVGATKIPAGENSNSGYVLAVNETSRVTGSRWGGLRGYRLAEGDTFTKSKPNFRKVQWELKKYGVLVYGTDELLKDARQFSAIVEQGSREELAFMMNDDIFRGVGTSGAQGIMNSSALITVTRDTGAKILGTDISAMWQRLDLRSKSNAAWYINPDCAAQLDGLFAVGSTAVLFPYAGYTADGVRTLYGKPIIETEFNASLNTTGDILLADLSQYVVFEKGGIESASSIHVEFLTDQEVFRYIARMDGSANVASALTPANGSNTTSPFVVLGSAT